MPLQGEQLTYAILSCVTVDLFLSAIWMGRLPPPSPRLSQTDGLMDEYLSNQDYKATWSLHEPNNSEKRPGMRGGHQLVIDSNSGTMYLFGGWDGFEDLSDLWCYNIKRNSWTLIHEKAEDVGGPSPRSCHKMVYDPCNSQIFTLGRYLDSNTRMTQYIKVCAYSFFLFR